MEKKDCEQFRALIDYVKFTKRINQAEIAEGIGIKPTQLSDYLGGRVKDTSTLYYRVMNKYCPEGQQTVSITHSPHAIGAINSTINAPAPAASEELLRPLVPTAIYRQRDCDVLEYCRNHPVEMMEVTQQLASIDLLLRVVTPAMEPTVGRGDLVAVSIKQPDARIIGGQAYVIDTRSSGVLMRRCYEREEGVLCRADNDKYEDVLVSPDDIIRMYIIVGIMRTLV